ncbi:protein SFI1 homolog [Plectropomus leopardus]|uniref:protein SFI1 homolog n=1 Tax=Plectropomus leopardus TaxID=160734 RepID=UPI001C4C070B|nr:protein SFI1 homolog [Plectropomus leopardus]
MQSNVKQPDPVRPVRPRPSSSISDGLRKQVRKVHSRKVPYRVGYSWNKGGRLKELRIRHLARKFLKIWMQNTFGRILPHKANWVHTDQQRMRLVWERWEDFTEMRRMKNRMLESALEQNKLATLHSAWSLWQARLQQREDLHTLEDEALRQRARALQRRAWLQWKEMHTAACCQKEKESRAALHFILTLKRKTLHSWKTYVSCFQTKKKSQAVAQRACDVRLVMMCWRKWSNTLHHKRSAEDRLEAAEHLAVQSTLRRALERWKALDMMLCKEEAERNRTAIQHHHHHLLRAGLQGLSLNVLRNKTQRLNNNMAVQHHHQTMTCKYWKLWQDRLEEAEDKSFQPLTEMALTHHRASLLSSCFHHWGEKLSELRRMQELERRADIWFAERVLPRCFDSWVEFTLQKRRHKQMRHKAEAFNRQRQYASVFYTWWGRSEEHKEQMLSERMAILHAERCHVQRAWTRWRQRTEERMDQEEKQKASDRLYMHRLLHKTMTQWKDTSTEIRDRRDREQQACHQADLRCMRWAVNKWKKFVQIQRVKKCHQNQMQRYYEVKLLKRTFVAWKKHHLHMCQIYGHAEQRYRQQKQNSLRSVLCVWRENTVLLTEVRLREQQAQNHFQHFLQLKVLHAWREATTRAVSKRHQQEEAIDKVQRSVNQVRLLRSFRRWRERTREARRERILLEKARRHHNSKLLSKALKGWNKHHSQCQKNKVMKRQGILLLRLKMYQTFFEQWKIKLQHRRREAKQTERALWHWSLTLQAKVLFGWRLWVTEQRRKREQAARAAQIYRDQLLREGVTCILSYAAHMNDLTTTITQHSQEQRSRRLQRVVRRCAMRWKQRALCKPRREQEIKEQQPKKSVTFCLTTPGSKSVSPSDPEEQGAEGGVLSNLVLSRAPRRQPRRCVELFESPLNLNTQQQTAVTEPVAYPSQLIRPSQEGHRTPPSCLHPPKLPVASADRSIITSNISPSEPHMFTEDAPQETQNYDILLPPSAFMTPATEDTINSSGFGKDAPHVPPFQQLSSASSDARVREDVTMDPASALTEELLSIQLDMMTYQEDRKQLRAWQKLKEVLQSWLQTSGKDEQLEKNAVFQELKELEERIDRLSAELAKRKPTMLLHAERIRHLQTALQASGVYFLHRKIKETETDRSVFTA